VTRSSCRSYVTWYNEVTSGSWATWEPGSRVEPGYVGTFNKDSRFGSYRTLESLDVHPTFSRERQIRPRLYCSAKDLRYETKLAGQSPAGFHLLGHLDAGLRFTAEQAHACVLCMADASEKSILNQEEVLEGVKALLLEGKWSLDWHLVISRVRARRGFAAVSQNSGQNLELRASGDLQGLARSLDLGSAEFTPAAYRVATDFQLYEFDEQSTPAFGPTVRVRRDLWHRLLPWSRDGYHLIDPAGNRYPPRYVPPDLSAFPPETRRYLPPYSAISVAELSAMGVGEVFEEVRTPDEPMTGDSVMTEPGRAATSDATRPAPAGAVVSFPLPLPEQRARIAAAGKGLEAPVLLDTSSPDGTVIFTLYDRKREYWLEVTLAPSVPLPAIVRLRYGTDSGDDRDLLIPVADDGTGQPSSVVRLEGYQPRSAWYASPPVLPPEITDWAPDVVTGSIRAAATAATAQAWGDLVTLLQPDTAALVIREVRAHWNQP